MADYMRDIHRDLETKNLMFQNFVALYYLYNVIKLLNFIKLL